MTWRLRRPAEAHESQGVQARAREQDISASALARKCLAREAQQDLQKDGDDAPQE